MDLKDKSKLYTIKGIRIIYAYSLDIPGFEGYVKISDSIFPLSFEDIKTLNSSDEKEISELYYSDVKEITESFGGEVVGVWPGRFNGENSDLQITASDIVSELDNLGIDKINNKGGVLYKADSCIIETAVSNARKIAEDNYNKKFKKPANNKSKKKESKENETQYQPLLPPVSFRPEQKKAIEETVKHFEEGKSRFLWNAKMRFGKTLSALEVAKRRGYKTTLIITHRPVVDASWYEDFKKIFHTKKEDRATYFYGRRDEKDGDEFEGLLRNVEEGGKLVFFVSMQYLRLSKLVGGKEQGVNKERDAILNYPWDFVVIDEAHEGTKSDKGANVMYYMHLNVPEESTQNVITVEEYEENGEDGKIQKEDSRLRSPRDNEPDTLSLSGTPFNLFNDFNADEVFTWDYVKEQKAKKDWTSTHDNDPNPYDVLPKLHIFNNDMKRDMDINIEEQDDKGKLKDFTFSLLFETKKNGKFKYEDQVKKFLFGLITAKEGTNYPFSTPEFREAFKHTFWLVPGVKEGKALKELMEKEDEWEIDGVRHENIYKKLFHVVNVCGNKNDDVEDKGNKDLQRVRDAIRKVNSNEIKGDFKGNVVTKRNTITLSCGKLTTGVSVPEWTAVFYLKGGDDTAASAYLQAIFRVQTPAVIDGYQKTDCYVFDFAPTRSLKVFADAVRLNLLFKDKINPNHSQNSAEIEKREEEELSEWLKYCPLVPLAGDNAIMQPYSAKTLFDELSNRLTEKAVNSGFSDNSVFSMAGIMSIDANMFKELAGAINRNPSMDKVETIYIKRELKESGSTRNKSERKGKGKKEEKTEEEIQHEEFLKERRNRLTTLKAMAMRIPLLMYGADVDDKADPDAFEINNFLKLFENDEESWKEFMPNGVTIEMFKAMIPAFDSRVFRTAAHNIRAAARKADEYLITDRIKAIAEIFEHFHNPDKETVLTPWRVVNMHMSQTLGGYNFFDDEFKEARDEDEPKFVDNGEVTYNTLATQQSDDPYKREAEIDQRRILEINSKTGLYPLYVAYSIFQDRKAICKAIKLNNPDYEVKEDQILWEETLKNNLFVVCRTPMARAITKRTLAGFKEYQVNVVSPTWKISERKLVKAGVKKMDKGEKIDDSKEYEVDIIDLLRVEDSEMNSYLKKIESKKNKGVNAKGILKEPESYFKKDVTSKNWWQQNLPLNNFDNIKKDMIKFDAVVGNPPYQLSNDGEGNGKNPIYHLFIEIGKNLSSIGTLIHPGRFLFNGGKTPKNWNNKILNDPHFKIVKYWDPEHRMEVFENVDIKGGIAISLWNQNVNYEPIETFFQFDELKSILDKVRIKLNEEKKDYLIVNVGHRGEYKTTKQIGKEFPSLKKYPSIYSTDIFNKLPNIFFSQKPKDDKDYIEIIGSEDKQKKIKWVNKNFIDLPEDHNSYRVIIPYANGSGVFGEKLTPAFVIKPHIAFTETYISIGSFGNDETGFKRAKACEKYIRTKFLRTLLGIKKVTQHTTSDVWCWIPLEDFSDSNKDIDWNKEIKEIDAALFKKYGLNPDEIEFIESKVKPMKD